MTVVRYTFDVCLRDGLNKDTYGMGGLIAESILGTAGVCGCELVHKADAEGKNTAIDNLIKYVIY